VHVPFLYTVVHKIIKKAFTPILPIHFHRGTYCTHDKLATTYRFGRFVPIRVIAHPDNETRMANAMVLFIFLYLKCRLNKITDFFKGPTYIPLCSK